MGFIRGEALERSVFSRREPVPCAHLPDRGMAGDGRTPERPFKEAHMNEKTWQESLNLLRRVVALIRRRGLK
jgi:hypothetical protein